MNAKLAGYVEFSQSIKDSIDSLGKQGACVCFVGTQEMVPVLRGLVWQAAWVPKQWFQSETNKRPPHAPGRGLLN